MVERHTHETGHTSTAWEELVAEVERPEFFTKAACVGEDPELFYPHPSATAERELARAICAGCPVRNDCLEWAIEHNEREGIWGGLLKAERIEHIRARGIDGLNSTKAIQRRERLAKMPHIGVVSPKKMAAVLGVDERTALRDLKWLREKGVA